MEQIVPSSEEEIKTTSEDMAFVIKCFRLLKRLNYVRSQYDYSEHFLGMNKYYFAMILSEGRIPSIKCISNLVRNLNNLHSQNAITYLAQMQEQGQQLITKRLFKFL